MKVASPGLCENKDRGEATLKYYKIESGLLPLLLSKDPIKPVKRSRVGHLMISEHLQQRLLCDLCICQPRVLEKRSGLLDHLTLRFNVSFSTECAMFFIYHRCTPPDRLTRLPVQGSAMDFRFTQLPHPPREGQPRQGWL